MQHTFTLVNGSWLAPNGYQATLTQVGSTYKLAFFDQSYLSFSSAGVLTAETDHDGNQTGYSWSAGNLTISAANGQSITTSFSGGQIQSASYATTAGTRTISYSTSSPWQVSYYPNNACARTVSYGYNGVPELTSITQANWPSSGSSANEGFAATPPSSRVGEHSGLY